MFGLDVIFQIIFRVESFLTKVAVEAIVEAAAVVDVTAGDDIQAFSATYRQLSFLKIIITILLIYSDDILAIKPKTLHSPINQFYTMFQLNISGETFQTN